MATVFISHSTEDKPFARKLANDLRELGHEPWFDEWQIQVGDCIVSKLQHGLADSEFVVLILSPGSVSSGWVDREWKSAYWSDTGKKHRTLLPVLLIRCELPGFLAGLRYADFTSDYRVGFSALATVLSRHLQSAPAVETRKSPSITLIPGASEQILVQIEFTTTGSIVNAKVPTNLKISELKQEIMRSQGYSNQFLDGRVADTYLYSKTQKRRLDDSQTAGDSGICDGEVIRLHFFCTAG